MGIDGEIIGAVLAGGVAVGAGIGRALAALWPATHRPSTKPPPTCAPTVVEQVDELHKILALRNDMGTSLVLLHLAELPKIRTLLEQIAERLAPNSPATPAE
jgi:hypothetical protein